MTELYISSISMNMYGPKAKPNGGITVNGALSVHFALTEEEAGLLSEVARKIFENRQREFTEQIGSAKISTPLLGVIKTIDGDIPF